MTAAADWGAIGAIVGAVGLLGGLLGVAVKIGRLSSALDRSKDEMTTEVKKVQRQVTPKPTLIRDGTLASSVGRIEQKVDDHTAKDERRFGAIFPELGIEDPEKT
jgi:hypothetical protein